MQKNKTIEYCTRMERPSTETEETQTRRQIWVCKGIRMILKIGITDRQEELNVKRN